MANYSIKGVVKLDLTAEQSEWATAVLEEACTYLNCLDAGKVTSEALSSLSTEAQTLVDGLQGVTPDFGVYVENGSVRVFDTFGFETEMAARWVKLVLNKFDIATPVSFNYILDWDKAVPGGYGGGAIIVTRHRVITFDLDEMVASELAKQKAIDELCALVEAAGGDVLDNHVANDIEDLGTNIGERGVHAQIEFLMSSGWSVCRIKNLLTGASKEGPDVTDSAPD